MIAMADTNDVPETEEPRGISCPRCGCADLRYSYHRIVFGKKRQVKFCRHCGRRVIVEVVEKVIDDGRNSDNRMNHGQIPLNEAEQGFVDGKFTYD